MEAVFSKITTFFSQPWFASVSKITMLVVVCFVSLKVLNALVGHVVRRIGFDFKFVRPVHQVLRWIVVGSLSVVAFSALGISLDGVWTFLTTLFALIAVGFIAVWSVLSNFVCAFLILIHKPFEVGDEVSFPGETISGKMVDLSLIYTSLRGSDGGLFQVPNNLFFQKTILCRKTEKPVRTLLEQLRSNRPADRLDAIGQMPTNEV